MISLHVKYQRFNAKKLILGILFHVPKITQRYHPPTIVSISAMDNLAKKNIISWRQAYSHFTNKLLMHLLMKDCDSGVHTVVNLANSFNTDVGYSSETSRAASHPSSVAFKRRSFTNKSASQNYSSPTESLGSQAGHGDAIGCSQSPSPSPMDGFSRPGRPADPRRLSYKRFFFFVLLLHS